MMTKKRIKTVLTIVIVAMFAVGVPAVQADTNNVLSGDITKAAGWDNGLPTSGNPGFIAVDGIVNDDTWGFGKDTVITQTAGTIDGGSKTMNFGAFNGTDGGGTWNMSGGTITVRAININATSNSTINISGGALVLNHTGIDLGKGAHISASKSGSYINISGSAVLDETNATKERNTGGNYDIASGWTGYWTCGVYSGDSWKIFVVANITLNGLAVDAATFDSVFTVTDGGQTLSMGPPDPNRPSVDAGVDMITWSGEGVPMDPNVVEAPGSDWGSLTYLWTAEPNGIGDPNLDVVITGADTENASVTVTKASPTGDAIVVRMRLAVNNAGNPPEKAVTDSMNIYVYDDACVAALDLGLTVIDPTDVDGNCITNFKDFAVMAMTWLDDYALTEAVAK